MKKRRKKIGGSGESWREDAVNHAKDYILHISLAISFNPHHEPQVRMILHLFPDEKTEVHERLQYPYLENPWIEETGKLQSMGSKRVGHN